jgi:ubiquinone/menaquinone biosynthesis C-methylase UbiE
MTTFPVPKTARQAAPGLGKRLFAALMAHGGVPGDRLLADRKRALFAPLSGEILEIGPGTGPNLPYVSPNAHWIGVEPNAAMFPYLRQAAQKVGVTVELCLGTAAHLPAKDSSLDAIISTFVLCSVPDPHVVLQEVLRVLRPGGRFVFIEHVAAPRGTALRQRQAFFSPLSLMLGDGCHPDRKTGATIEQAGFAHTEIEHFRLPVLLYRPHIAGRATK